MRSCVAFVPALLSCLSSMAVASTVTAHVEMMGFSADSQHFVLAETTPAQGLGGTEANLTVWNVSLDDCIPEACHLERQALGQGEALKQVLTETWTLRKNLGLTPPQPGFGTTLQNRSEVQVGPKEIHKNYDFLESGTGRKFHVALAQTLTSTEGDDAMSNRTFYEAELCDENDCWLFAGTHDGFDERGYEVAEVRLSPDRKSLALLMTRSRYGYEGTDTSYFVRFLRL